jgi:hypothetical protein
MMPELFYSKKVLGSQGYVFKERIVTKLKMEEKYAPM